MPVCRGGVPARAPKQPGEQPPRFSLSKRRGPERPGEGIDLWRDVVEHADVGIALLGHQADLAGKLWMFFDREIAARPPGRRILSTSCLLTVNVIQMGRSGRWSRAGSAGDADQRPDGLEMVGDDPVEGRLHVGVAEIDRGNIDPGLGIQAAKAAEERPAIALERGLDIDEARIVA